jgi:hypothetical protein
MWIDDLIPDGSEGAVEAKKRMRSSYARLLRKLDIEEYPDYPDETVRKFNSELCQYLSDVGAKIFRYCYKWVLVSDPTIGDSDEAFKKYIRLISSVIQREMERLYSEYRAQTMNEIHGVVDPNSPPWGDLCMSPLWRPIMEEEAWTVFLDGLTSPPKVEKQEGLVSGVVALLEQDSAKRRAAIDAYISLVESKTGERITRTDIWKKAGYRHRREFEGWQRGQARTGSAVDNAIRLVLREKPHLKPKQ